MSVARGRRAPPPIPLANRQLRPLGTPSICSKPSYSGGWTQFRFPPLVSAFVLWVGLLVCILRGFSSQLDLWRKLTTAGVWRYPRVAVSDMAIYQRLARTPPHAFQALFQALSTALATHFHARSTVPEAAFASGIYALDQTVLDPASAKLQIFRGVPKGAHHLLPGVLGCVFDVRRQLWQQVTFSPHALQTEKPGAPALVADLPRGSLLLCDLGYFSFAWLDRLTHAGFSFVCRLPEKTTYHVLHVFGEVRTARVRLRESLVYLGAGTEAHHSHAAHPVRLIEVYELGPDGSYARTRTYLTNVLDPRPLSARAAVALYGRRGDIEAAFKLCKTHLKLHLVWSAQVNTVLHQVYATLLLAQVVSALRYEIAQRAQVEERAVSVELLRRWLPEFAAAGQDPLATFVQEGRRLGFIRAFRGCVREVPEPEEGAYTWPTPFPPPRPARYPGYGPGTPQRELQEAINQQLGSASSA